MKYKDGSVNVMAVNCGSSSLKYKVIRMPEEKQLIIGEAERVGLKTQESAVIHHTVLGKKRTMHVELPDHSYTFRKALELIKEDSRHNKEVGFDVFAHRYVHPGSYFSKTTMVNKAVIEKLKNTLELAPIHNPVSFKLIELCSREYPDTPPS